MYISIRKVAERLGVKLHHSTPIRWYEKGILIDGELVKLPATRFGRKIYVDEADLLEFVEKMNRGKPTTSTEPARPSAKASAAETSGRLDDFGV